MAPQLIEGNDQSLRLDAALVPRGPDARWTDA
jgi:hypothetical protein